MDHINIRFAKINDFNRVLSFIKEYWDENNIFVKYPLLMEYQHVFGEDLNFVIAEDIETKDIMGVLGFMKCNKDNPFDLTTALWQTAKSSRPMLGIEILKYLYEKSNPRLFFSCGIRPKTLPIFKYLSWPTGKLSHYYRLSDQEHYQIAIVTHKNIIPSKGMQYRLIWLEDTIQLKENFDASSYKNCKPYKDYDYFEHRYYHHPIYTYKIYGIDTGEKINSILVTREISCNNVKILRIADFIGMDEDLSKLSGAVQELMDHNAYEYIEFYNYGIPSDIMAEAGFTLRNEQDKNILPSHFEPFEQENIEHYFFTTDMASMANLHVYKGDSDQDTPKCLPLDFELSI